MEIFEWYVAKASNFLWTYILSIILISTGLLYAFKLKFFQIRFFPHAVKQTLGTIFKKNKHKGTISPFQAFTSALGVTAGATNIVGVPIAIAAGGPGALFWMWVVALLGMGTKYAEIVLGLKYREKNKEGEWVGGPQYYIKKGLGWNMLAGAFALFLMIELIPSAMVQSNSISTQLEGAFGLNTAIVGGGITIFISMIVFGGIKRIGKVTDKLVPFMIITYIIVAMSVILYHFDQIPAVFMLIFEHAFTPISAVGGFAGAGVSQALRWGLARGLYSNEAGIGTGPIAHAAAMTDHPSKQALWGIVSVFIDTIVICTISGVAVLVTGAWEKVSLANASNMINIAISSLYGDFFGGAFIAFFLFFFVLTTIIVLIYYGEKQAEYLFNLKVAKIMRIIYLIAIFIGAVGGLQFVWQFLDLLLAMVVLVNIIPLILLNKEVKEITEDYIYRIYKKEPSKKAVPLFYEKEAFPEKGIRDGS